VSALPDGTQSSPSLSFLDDSDTGIYRLTSGEVGVAANGTRALWIAPNTTLFRDGSATNPGIGFQNDTNTGFWRNAADNIVLTTGGSSRLSIDNSAIYALSQIRMIDGSSATPSVTFTNDINSGLYSAGADSVGIAVGGVGNLLVDTTRVTVPTGSIVNPSLVFSGANNTGFSRPGPAILGVSIAGATAAVFGANFTPTSTADTTGVTNQISFDDNYIYVKTSGGWKRATLNTF